MCENQQNVQVIINQNNQRKPDSPSNSSGLGGIILMLLLGAGGVWLLFILLGSAFRALGQGLEAFGAGIASINWLGLIGGILLGIAIWVAVVAIFCYSLVKGRDYMSAAAERRKARSIIDLEPLEEKAPVQLAEAKKVLTPPRPVLLNLENQIAYDHEQ